jgi:hypothetical protein
MSSTHPTVIATAARKSPARFPARAHFVSFNFPNSLICANVSSAPGIRLVARLDYCTPNSALAAAMILHHIARMSKSPRVTFKPKRIAEGEWQIQAECPGVETKFVTGFKSKAEIDEWLAGDGKIKWLRSQGYAK